MIEQELFKQSIIDEDKLIPYGFIKKQDKYIISKNILNNTFRIDVSITNKQVIGRVYDLEFNEEYTNYRLNDELGNFSGQVKEEFINFLLDIKDNCTHSNYFIYKQTNRLHNLIFNKYHDNPEFLWDNSLTDAVYRNKRNNKWYALIMNINRTKLDNIDEDIEVINLKLDNTLIKKLLKRKGFYKAYHMNKDNWITIILNDTLSDEEIMVLIEQSHKYTEEIKEWIIPANIKYYDVINCFNDTDTIMWKQVGKIYIGDIAYLYVGSPYSCILYKCEVIEINIPYTYKSKELKMDKVMKLKLLKRYKKDEYPLEVLKKYGVTSIRGQRTITKELSNVL